MSRANGKSMLTITEAAEVAGVERRIIQRRLGAGEFPHAHKEGKGRGRWLIPTADLEAAFPAGDNPVEAHAPAGTGAPVAPDGPTGPGAPIEAHITIGPDPSAERVEPMVVPVLSEIEILRAEVVALRIRAEVAEAEARERDRVIAAKDDDLNSLRTILVSGPALMPTGSPSAIPEAAPEPPAAPPRTALSSLWSPEGPVPVEPEPPRRHWWQGSAPPPAPLDSFWLTDEPVVIEAPSRPWWRIRWPGSKKGSDQEA